MNKSRLNNSSILPLLLALYSCSESKSTGENQSITSGDGLVSLSYINSRNANALIPLANSSVFPDLGGTINGTNSGSFVQFMGTCDGANIDLDFSITNTGTGTLKSTQSPAVSFTDLTTYDNNIGAENFSYTLVTAPSFPLAPNSSTTFRVRFTNSNNASCRYGHVENFYDGGSYSSATRQVFRMEIHTDDSINPDYGTDLTILGNS